jgi:hypothetical protein
MNGRRALALLVLAVAVAAALALFAIGERPAPHSPEQLVPTSWHNARETPMHVLHVGTKNVACTECHGASTTPGTAPVVLAEACGKCHASELESGHVRKGEHRDGTPAAATTCLSCHVFGANKAAARCNDCHAATHRAPDAPALEHHASAEIPCGSCHSVHAKQRTTLPDCTQCHTSVSAVHGTFASDAGSMCTACHAPHSAKETALGTCEGCHVGVHADAGSTPHVAPRGPGVASHQACVTCHEPHRARRADVRSCRQCHADHAGVSAVAGHAVCTGCHAPHAPAEARTSCSTTCHATVTTFASVRAPAHAVCTSCHDPHRPDKAPGQACEGCHESTKPSHPAVASAAGAMGRCVGCHAPHAREPAGVGAALCAKCHADKTAATTTRSGHQSCSGCHADAHSPVAKPSCTGCHAEETRTAPAGHATCTSCHDAHSGSLGTHASCTNCHTDKAKAQHGSIPTGCGSCHRPHGGPPSRVGPEKPPACASCHSRPSLQGLHGISAHGSCESCHTTHAPPRSDRATCTTTCHTDRRNHQPAATSCKGCHLFRE